MRIDLEDYARNLRVFDGLVPLDEARYAADGIRPRAPSRLHLEVQGDARLFRLSGTLELDLELECSRCLRPFSFTRQLPFELLLAPQSEAPGEGDFPVEDQQLEVSFFREPQLELEDLVQEQVYLARPMKPICHPDCRGLCAHCGADLNEGLCGCEAPASVSPFAILRREKT